MKDKKICFASSSGGHFEQLLMLQPLMVKYESFIVTEKTTYLSEMSGIKTYYVKQINRKEKSCYYNLCINLMKSIKIFIKERPDVIVCTGVLATVPICLIAKICGKKLIYIESFAKVTSQTISGKLLYKFSDQFYVQWENMLNLYPKAIFLGGIY